jgi:TetR/AcrR family transcriptional regulator, transcriptional repressor for nem operon
MPKVKLFDTDVALEKAKDIFWRKGYNATSMQDLVEGMQISRQSLYDTYGNKQTLFEKCLLTYQQEAFQFNCNVLQSHQKTISAIRAFFDYLVESIVTDTHNKNCFLINTLMETIPDDTHAKKIIENNINELEKTIHHILKKGKAANDYRSAFSVTQLTHHIIAAMHGIKVIGKLKKDRKTLHGMVDTAMAVFEK